MAGELSCPSCRKIFVAGVSGVGSCSGCGARVSIAKNPSLKQGDWVRITSGEYKGQTGKITGGGAQQIRGRAMYFVVSFAGYPYGRFPASDLDRLPKSYIPPGGRKKRRRNPPSDDKIIVQSESGGYGVHYIIKGDSAPDELNRVAVVPEKETAERLAQTLHTETGARVISR